MIVSHVGEIFSVMDLEKQKIRKAVEALYTLIEKTKDSNLLDEAPVISVQFGFKKIPSVKNKTLRLKLPHSVRKEAVDVCLFVKDWNKKQRDYDPTVHHYKEVLEKHGITAVTQIIPMKSLKTEYKPYEAKRNLSNMYDVFLADKCIIRLLPSFLGKHFYGRKRSPIGVNMQAKDLKKEMDQVLDNSQCVIRGRGSSNLVNVGHAHMKQAHVADNVIASANQLAAGIPGGPKNIKNMFIKTGDSVAIPIYFSSDEGEISLPLKEKKKEIIEPEEITTVVGAKVKVTPYGDVTLIREKDTEEGEEKTDMENLNKKTKLKSLKRPKKNMTSEELVKLTGKKAKTDKSDIKQPKKKQKTFKSK